LAGWHGWQLALAGDVKCFGDGRGGRARERLEARARLPSGGGRLWVLVSYVKRVK
jgi:hypothetical protein